MPVRDDINRARRQFIFNSEEVIKKIMLDFFRSVVESTPVDTGALRGSWQVSIGVPPTSTGVPDKEGDDTQLAGQIEMFRFRVGQTIYIASLLPYAAEVERGTSRTPPGAMIRSNIQRIDLHLQKEARRVVG